LPDFYAVNMNVMTEDPSQIPRVMEIMGRVASGLAMEGLIVNVNVQKVPEDPDAAG
jgi:hypothetical protein